MKSILLFFALVGSSILFYGCPLCGEVTKPYYEIGSFVLFVQGDLIIEESDTLIFSIGIDSIHVTAALETRASRGGDAAFATSCATDGERGLKSPIDSIAFFTVNNWDASHPAGSSVNDLVEQGNYVWQSQGYLWTELPLENEWTNTSIEAYYRILSRPSTPGDHIIKATLYTLNGKSVTGETSQFFVQ